MRDDRAIAIKDLAHRRCLQRKRCIGTVCDHLLRHLGFTRVRKIDDLKDFGHLVDDALFDGPPRIAAVENLRLRRSLNHFPRTCRHRPAFSQIVVGEFQPVLIFVNVFRHDVDTDVEFVSHEVQELRARTQELN